MVRPRQQFEIFWPVIRRVVVYMMHYFVRRQMASYDCFYDEPVFTHKSPDCTRMLGFMNKNITEAIDLLILSSWGRLAGLKTNKTPRYAPFYKPASNCFWMEAMYLSDLICAFSRKIIIGYKLSHFFAYWLSFKLQISVLFHPLVVCGAISVPSLVRIFVTFRRSA